MLCVRCSTRMHTYAGAYGDPSPRLYNFDGFELEAAAPVLPETIAQRVAVRPDVGYAVGPANPAAQDPVAFFITDSVYWVLVVVTGGGVVLVDAPPDLAAALGPAVRELAGEAAVVSHLVYSHSHRDHIGAAAAVAAEFPDVEVRACMPCGRERAADNHSSDTIVSLFAHALGALGRLEHRASALEHHCGCPHSPYHHAHACMHACWAPIVARAYRFLWRPLQLLEQLLQAALSYCWY